MKYRYFYYFAALILIAVLRNLLFYGTIPILPKTSGYDHKYKYFINYLESNDYSTHTIFIFGASHVFSGVNTEVIQEYLKHSSLKSSETFNVVNMGGNWRGDDVYLYLIQKLLNSSAKNFTVFYEVPYLNQNQYTHHVLWPFIFGLSERLQYDDSIFSTIIELYYEIITSPSFIINKLLYDYGYYQNHNINRVLDPNRFRISINNNICKTSSNVTKASETNFFVLDKDSLKNRIGFSVANSKFFNSSFQNLKNNPMINFFYIPIFNQDKVKNFEDVDNTCYFFYNQGHLNDIGSILFSQSFANYILNTINYVKKN